jgi:hypothetical protein
MPRKWLSTPSSSPRGATPLHGGSWGISRRPLPNLQTTEAPGFSLIPDRQPLLDKIGDLRLGGYPGGPCPTRMNVEHTGFQHCNQTEVEPEPACIYPRLSTTYRNYQPHIIYHMIHLQHSKLPEYHLDCAESQPKYWGPKLQPNRS